MRRKVRDLLNPEAPKHGEVGRGRDRVDNIKSNGGGTSESYTVRRLKRDRPELYERVVDVEEYERVAAKERQGTRSDITQTIAEGEEGEAREKAAQKVGRGWKKYHPFTKGRPAKRPPKRWVRTREKVGWGESESARAIARHVGVSDATVRRYSEQVRQLRASSQKDNTCGGESHDRIKVS